MKMRYSKSGLKRLASDLLQQRWLFLLATIGTIVQVALTIYLPILIGNAVDSVLLPDASQHLLPILSKMGMVIVANTAIQWINPLIYNQLIYSYSQKLRDAVIQKIHRLPLAYLDRQGNGDLVSRLTTDVEQLNNGLLMVFNQFFVGVLTILVTIVTMAKIDFFMMVLVLLLTPLSMLIARFIARKSYKLFQKQTTARGLQTQLIEESLSQESLIQSFNAQEQFITDFTKGNESYADYSQDAIFYSSTVNPATRFVNALIYAIVVGFGAVRIINGSSFTVGQLVTFLNYVNQYTKPFNDISSVMAELQSALACAERLYMILDEKEVVETGKEELTSEAVRGAIRFEHVRFGYEKDKPLIHDLNMTVPAGSKVAIVGPTGAGKSTLINLLMRFYNVDAGKIKLDDRDITDYTRVSFRQQFGMVLQETWLKTATIHENIAFGRPEASREEVIAAAKAANAHFFIQQLPHGYDTYLADAGDSLSQGQRQLLTIARVFLAVPKILILDEATSSIDTRTEVLIQEAFNKLMVGRTSFIIAHRLSTIQNADIILVLVDGDIVEYGSHQELMQAKGVYYQMQTAQGSLAV
ncbi:ABC transporter ATP-binding protein [Streptococcus anginosus]|uniref:Putative multidrug ABC transporter permease/ATPase n=1 Tax=Streptococcus anginosus TaxID=1328 RepID=A0A3S4M165_STRAP|nr:ABC transporter ATP-binding protein [Streptococcus anginosus]GAD40459.1 ABC-type multidrug transport system, ATPase/permease components [Streptococcus intermedius SK54 = ATCC 27335]EGL45335.1 ABC transporter, ATP-binding protein [Streptococcus anginosus SK52 = DSM 20563]MBX9101187.1 ABC transporter ATP-binding protein [Streptococcus anginosus]MBZ2156943.1 ABC transporter ATP-binding protein/permease [Streptococcus anginosus]ORE83475.1 sugar ABC transporter ATP-binding protein [Streptococcus